MDLDLVGCFAMTEHGHGSDVQHLRTTATYDPATSEFVVDTRTGVAMKEYIGNAARDGHMAAVFAQLVTEGESRGVHAFLVPIRDDDGTPSPGVLIEDCGLKAGPERRRQRPAVLFAGPQCRETPCSTASGTSRRTGRTRARSRATDGVSSRCSARSSAAASASRAAPEVPRNVRLTIAVRYGELRRQFARPDGDEVVILDYLAHQRKLLPALATTYALNFAQEGLVASLHDIDDDAPEEVQRELESRAAGIKAVSTWHTTQDDPDRA